MAQGVVQRNHKGANCAKDGREIDGRASVRRIHPTGKMEKELEMSSGEDPSEFHS